MDSYRKLQITLPKALESIHTCCNAFRIVKRIGKGSQGHVFLALHVPTMKVYAIKRIKSNTVTSLIIMKNELKTLRELCRIVDVGDDGLVQPRQSTVTFCQKCINESGLELNECGKLVEKIGTCSPTSPVVGERLKTPGSHNCPYIVEFFDSFPDVGDGSRCFVLEYMRWGSLQDVLSSGRLFHEHELSIIAFSVLQALVFLDKHGYVHRDVKPANILLDAWGRVKLGDFGTACAIDQQCSQGISLHDSLVAGTLNYMSPECFQEDCYSHKSDIWSLGVALTHLMHGTRPFADSHSYWGLRNCVTSATLLSYLPESAYRLEHSSVLMDFLEKCVDADVSQRSTAQELLQMPFITAGAVAPQQPKENPMTSPTSVTAADATTTDTISTTAFASAVATAVSAATSPAVDLTPSKDEPNAKENDSERIFPSFSHDNSSSSPHAEDGNYTSTSTRTSTDKDTGTQQRDTPKETPRLRDLVAELHREQPPDLSVLACIIGEEWRAVYGSAAAADEQLEQEENNEEHVLARQMEALAEQLGIEKDTLDKVIEQKLGTYTEYG